MFNRPLLVGFFAIGCAVSLVFWIGSRSFGEPSTTVWGWGIATLVFLGLCTWAYHMKDELPDLLGNAGFRYFERDGFCFAVVPGVKDGQMQLCLWYQNRYSNPCTVEMLVRPSCGVMDVCPLSSLTLRIECDGGGHGQMAIPWEATDVRPNREINCYFGVDVRYPPQGCGSALRTRTGMKVGSIKDITGPKLLLSLVTTGVVNFPFPKGVTISPANEPASASPGAFGTTPSVIGSSTVEVKRSGSRVKSVVCERCGHSYDYTLRREATASAEDSGQSVARAKAEDAAQTKLDELLANGSDVVPCPKCKDLTSEMRQTKRRHRMEGLGSMVLGIVLIAVGLGICGFAHLIRESTHRLHYVIGVVGVGIAGLGILLALRGLFCALTGESLEGRQKPKD